MDKKKLTYIILASIAAGLLVTILIVWIVVFSLPKSQAGGDADDATVETESDIPLIEGAHESLIDGLQITEEEHMISVIIENHGDSRRQMAGLSEASLVFETEAEGGITRFLAFYPYQNTEKVGPVRSARPYFVRWSEMFDSAFTHAGASDMGYSAIYNSGRVFDLDGLALEGGLKYFTRDYLYYAPHNLFTNLEELRELMEDRNWDKPIEDSFLTFGASTNNEIDDEEVELGDSIHIYYPFPQYFVRYDYNPEKNNYKRYQAGEEHIDHGNEEQIAVSNVVVLITDYYPTDAEGRLYMKTEGKGDMYLFRNGKVYPGTWKKTTSLDPLKFYSTNDTELVFEPGNTWISVVNFSAGLQWE